MTAYMPKVGTLRPRHDVPHLHGAGEPRLLLRGRHGEEDARRRWRCSRSATALFANSPFTEGKPNGFLSLRSEIWRDTDNQRSGMLPFAFEPGMGFERYVDYALDVPMYFVKRGDSYIDVSGKSFRDHLAGKLDCRASARRISDWANHLSTIFPEVRLKRYPRDARRRRRAVAAAAGAAGVLGRPALRRRRLDAGWEIVKDWSAEERQKLRDDVPQARLQGDDPRPQPARSRRGCCALAEQGLARRERLDRNGRDETRYLRPLQEIVARGITPAEELLEKYHGPWNGSVEPIFDEYAY